MLLSCNMDGADLRLFQLVARKQPYLLSLSVVIVINFNVPRVHECTCIIYSIQSFVEFFVLTFSYSVFI